MTMTDASRIGTGELRGTRHEDAPAEARRLATVQDLNSIIDRLDATGGLTSGDLIARAAEDVGRIDHDIQSLMADMRARNDRAAALRGVTQAFQTFMNNRDAGTAFLLDQGEIRVAGLNNGNPMTYRAALIAAGANPAEIDRLGRSIDRTNPEPFKALLQGESQRVTEGSETDSLRLQSLVSQRNQVLQMTSQLIAAMTETSKGIIGHIGR